MSIFKYKFKHDIDVPERTLEHKNLILKKSFIKRIYTDWYKWFINEIPMLPPGKLVELGSGGGFLKQIEPSIVCTDILELPANDLTFSALDMPFENNEISGFFMVDTLHHIPDIEKFLVEADRVMKKGAKIMMVEPANSLWGSFVYKNFHHEPFNPNGTWQIPLQGPMSGANGALPWIVFERDIKRFNELFPDFKVCSIDYHSPIKYLISGGVSYRQLLPGFFYPFINGFDRLLSKISKQCSMFVNICIEKT